jgi:hypothetical protein
MLLTFIGAVIGAVFSILTTIVVEYFRRPRLDLTIEDPPDDQNYRGQGKPAEEMRAVRLELHNRRLPKWMGGWLVRSAALQCLGTITFHHLDDGENVFHGSMAARWAGSRQPVGMPAVGPQGILFQVFDILALTSESRIDVSPGEKEKLDVAVKMDADTECYGWNNESYFGQPQWRNARWKLPPGRYLVSVGVFSSGQKCTGIFRLINGINRGDFRLAPASLAEIRRIKL